MRRSLTTTAALLAALLGPAGASAGGWAVATLDRLPSPPVVGKAMPITFTIRQHGITPVDLADVAIVVTRESGASERFAARRAGAVGRYRADVRFAASERVTWRAELGWFGPQELGSLTIGDRTGGAAAGAWIRRLGLAGGAGLAALACMRELGRRRARKPLPA